jgi:hypothetical protein
VRLHRIVELRAKGWGWARIGKVVRLSDRAVGKIIASLPYDPKDGPPSLAATAELGETESTLESVETPTVEGTLVEPPVPEAELDLTAGEPDLLEAAVAAEGAAPRARGRDGI